MKGELTQEELKAFLSYDPETGVFTRKKYRSHLAKVGDEAGWVDTKGYIRIEINHKPYGAHRLAWLYVYGKFPDGQIDHINGRQGDNRIANLRIASNSENQQNVGLKRNNKSGFIGVHWHSRTNKWRAAIKINGRHKSLGNFTSVEEAAAARKKAEEALHPFRNNPSKMAKKSHDHP
jgi:hypothetical protein